MNVRAHARSAAVALVLGILALGSVDGSGEGDVVAEASGDDRPADPVASTRELEAPRSSSGNPSTQPRSVRSDLPDVLAMLSDEGYTTDQRDALFERDFEGRSFLVEGRIEDVGTWMGRKYVTIEVAPGNLCDVYLDDSFDILSVRKGGSGRFVGTFSFLGTGVMFHRQFEDGREAPTDLAASGGGRPASSSPQPARPASSQSGPRAEMRRIIARLWDGSLGLDQREELFARDYRSREVEVRGRVSDVGSWLGEKYVTIDLGGGHLVDVYPREDFDLLSIRIGESRGYVGRLEFLGVPEMLHHRVESAEASR